MCQQHVFPYYDAKLLGVIYFSIIYSNLQHCIPTWATCTSKAVANLVKVNIT